MIRPIKLARIAAEAEATRWRGLASRVVSRIIFAVVALVFVLGALTFAHVAAWYFLRVNLNFSFLIAAAILGGFDVVIAAICGFLASSSKPSKVERDALQVRRDAVAALGGAVSITQLAMPMLRFLPVGRRGRRK